MQWLLFASLFVVMAILQRLTHAGPLEARATLAVGFLTLAAYVGGELARRLRLPRITGFLLTGLVAGPAWLRLVRPEDLQALDMVSTGALALIALAAGSVVNLRELRQQRRTVLLVVAAAMAVPFGVVTLVVLTVSPWFPLTVHQPFRDAAVVALVLGATAAVSSPIVTWALSSEVGATGGKSLSHTVTVISIVQDAAAVVLILLLLLVAQPLASSGAVTPGIAVDTFLRLAASVAAGIGLGVVIAQYVRGIRTHTMWVLVAAAFVIAQAVRLLALEPVLMGLAAGCTIANVAPTETETVQDALARCMLPVHIVFFALLGSGLRLQGLTELWPWVLLLVGLRFVSLRAGLRWVGRNPAISSELVTYGWLGLVSQGGLAMTLAFVLRRAFPEWGITLESLVLATISVHLIAGPICYRWALRRAGEAPEGVHGVHGTADTESPGGRAALVPDGGSV